MSSLQETHEQLGGAVDHYRQVEEAAQIIQDNAKVEDYADVTCRAASLRAGLGAIASAVDTLVDLITSASIEQGQLDDALRGARSAEKRRAVNGAVDICALETQKGEMLAYQALGDSVRQGPADTILGAGENIGGSVEHLGNHVDALWSATVMAGNYLNGTRYDLNAMLRVAEQLASIARSASDVSRSCLSECRTAEAEAQAIGQLADGTTEQVNVLAAAEQQYLADVGAAV